MNFLPEEPHKRRVSASRRSKWREFGEPEEPRVLAPAFDEATKAALEKRAFLLRAPAGAWVFREGLACEGYPIVVSGRVRVQKTGANGREIALYRVGPGRNLRDHHGLPDARRRL